MRFWATLLALVLTCNISVAQNFFEKPPTFNTFNVVLKKEVFSKKTLDSNKFCVLYIDKDAPKLKFPTFTTTIEELKKVVEHKYDTKDEILIFKNKGGNLTTVSVKGKNEAEIVKFYKELYGDITIKKAVVENDKLVVVSTSWCIWCRKLEKEVLPFLHGIVKVEEVDNENTSTPYNVASYPTMIYFKNGKEVWRSGYLTAEQIKAKIGTNTSSTIKVNDKEYHVHKCSNGHEWSHTGKEKTDSHKCPQCGELVYEVYEMGKKIIKG